MYEEITNILLRSSGHCLQYYYYNTGHTPPGEQVRSRSRRVGGQWPVHPWTSPSHSQVWEVFPRNPGGNACRRSIVTGMCIISAFWNLAALMVVFLICWPGTGSVLALSLEFEQVKSLPKEYALCAVFGTEHQVLILKLQFCSTKENTVFWQTFDENQSSSFAASIWISCYSV